MKYPKGLEAKLNVTYNTYLLFNIAALLKALCLMLILLLKDIKRTVKCEIMWVLSPLLQWEKRYHNKYFPQKNIFVAGKYDK